MVDIRSPDWKESRHVSVANAKAKLLCKHHNSLLSTLDEAAKNTQDAATGFRRHIQKYFESDESKKAWHAKVDGLLLERWILKTTINVIRWGPAPFFGWVPNRYYVEAAFGKTSLNTQSGLGIYFFVPAPPFHAAGSSAGDFEIAPVVWNTEAGPALVGSIVRAFGFNMMLKLVPTENARLQGFGITNIWDSRLFHIRHQYLMEDDGSKVADVNLEFCWEGLEAGRG